MKNIVILFVIGLTLTGCSGDKSSSQMVEENTKELLTVLFTLPDDDACQIARDQGLETYEQLIQSEQLNNEYIQVYLPGMLESLEYVCDEDGLESVRNIHFLNEFYYCCLFSGAAYPESIEITRENDTWYKFTINESTSWNDEGFKVNGEVTLKDGLISNIHVNDGDMKNFFDGGNVRLAG
ncbi:MAG: hypothetical protein PHS94_02570 [Erysipelotrichaceae bacterium]|nr:hypothetical protein [Erysipelotrichaceae bacterium]